ncbi:MAG: NAD(P)H-hydrate dehydratase [Actinobacteria bacterium]|nr:NAD(P)H-hydrate dehydratase [Actinomycetota bacterium]
MAAVDAAAPEPVEVLVRRAAGAVERAAVELLGGTYGRRVVVVAGPGNNGEDGRVAAALLRRRGVRVVVVDVSEAPPVLGPADLVIDAAFGTGFHGSFTFPDPDGAPVLAVDIPSGVSGSTGVATGAPAPAVATVTFAALKPGLLLHDGPAFAGRVVLADIGLDVSGRTLAGPPAGLVTDADVVEWVPTRLPDDHKWRHAVRVVAGSPGMTGAARLCTAAALRAGAGYVCLTVPGEDRPVAPAEAVVVPLPIDGWSTAVLADQSRFAAVAIGPGLGRSDAVRRQVRAVLAGADRPVVLDGDGLWAIADDPVAAIAARPSTARRVAPTVLTPHDGELAALTGSPPGEDRIAAARRLAADTGSVVLLKGPTTVVADPGGEVALVRSGDARLATAGTGDVLTGVVAAYLAAGAAPMRAAAAAAHVHGRAAMLGHRRGLVAGDVVGLLPDAWDTIVG